MKSRFPSLPPVPSNEGHCVLPSSVRTTAVESQCACGPRHSARQVGISLAFRLAKMRSAAASKRLYPEDALILAATGPVGGPEASATKSFTSDNSRLRLSCVVPSLAVARLLDSCSTISAKTRLPANNSRSSDVWKALFVLVRALIARMMASALACSSISCRAA